MFNKVILLGRVDSKELKENYLTISLAHSEKITNGDKVEYKTSWFNCVFFGEYIEETSTMINKGDLLLVEGRLSVYEKDKKKYYSIIVDKYRNVSFTARILEERKSKNKNDEKNNNDEKKSKK